MERNEISLHEARLFMAGRDAFVRTGRMLDAYKAMLQAEGKG